MLSIRYLAIIFLMIISEGTCFWDAGTTTPSVIDPDKTPRQSFFRWEFAYSELMAWWYTNYNWPEIKLNRRLRCTAGISIGGLTKKLGRVAPQETGDQDGNTTVCLSPVSLANARLYIA
jgi:hypothetical protein